MIVHYFTYFRAASQLMLQEDTFPLPLALGRPPPSSCWFSMEFDFSLGSFKPTFV
jgi:hypothetical protein